MLKRDNLTYIEIADTCTTGELWPAASLFYDTTLKRSAGFLAVLSPQKYRSNGRRLLVNAQSQASEQLDQAQCVTFKFSWSKARWCKLIKSSPTRRPRSGSLSSMIKNLGNYEPGLWLQIRMEGYHYPQEPQDE